MLYLSEILVNGTMETIDFTSFPEGKTFNEVIIQKVTDNSTVYRMVFLSGIAVNVSPVSPLLSVSLALTSAWKGTVTGMYFTLTFS